MWRSLPKRRLSAEALIERSNVAAITSKTLVDLEEQFMAKLEKEIAQRLEEHRRWAAETMADLQNIEELQIKQAAEGATIHRTVDHLARVSEPEGGVTPIRRRARCADRPGFSQLDQDNKISIFASEKSA